MRKRVVITSMGTITAAGSTIEELWQSVRSGRSSITKLEGLGISNYIGAQIDSRKLAEYGDVDRSIALALHAAQEAISNSRLSPEELLATHAFIGSAKGGIGSLLSELDNMRNTPDKPLRNDLLENFHHTAPGTYIAKRFGLGGMSQAVVGSCATGTYAIIHAARFIASGRGERVLAGSTEASLTPLILAGYDSMGVLSKHVNNPEHAMKPFDINRDGFAAGEGAGILLLESLDSAQKRGAAIHAEVLGWAYGSDTYGITSHDIDGTSIAQQITNALDKAEKTPSDIDYFNAHGTATVHNDIAEVRGIKSAFGDATRDLHISSTKPVTGHLIGGAGSVETIITVLAMQNSETPPTANLNEPEHEFDLNLTPLVPVSKDINCAIVANYGFGGHIGVLVLGKQL